jgi:hypothetical protein
MSRTADVELISKTMSRTNEDLQMLLKDMATTGLDKWHINNSVDKALNSLDALKSIIKIVKVK